MGKKKKTSIEDPQITREARRMRPTEWAQERGLDPDLFAWWDKETMNESEFEELKKQRGA